MTPKEKALELVNKVDSVVCGDINERNAKDMAILICDEVLRELDGDNYNGRKYWEEVKQEINKL